MTQFQEWVLFVVILRKNFVGPRVLVFTEKTFTTNKFVLAILPAVHVFHKFLLRGLLLSQSFLHFEGGKMQPINLII